MKKVLIDTNLIIDREKNEVVQDELSYLLRLFNYSEKYAIVIHPKTIEELTGNKNENDRKVILSKVNSYTEIDNPPKAPESFHNIVGIGRVPNDIVDNELLYALKRGCASYFITNDVKLKKKAKKVDLSDCVFNVSEALQFFRMEEASPEHSFVTVTKKEIYNIDPEEPLFQSLNEEYHGFKKWFLEKAQEGREAYCSYDDKGELGSILVLKEETINDVDSSIVSLFDNEIKLKIATMKVDDNGKCIGEFFVKIIISEARKRGISQIYTTIFPSHEQLVELLLEYGFQKIGQKNTKRSNGDIGQEIVLFKNMKDAGFPNIDWEHNSFIIPILPSYVSKLFPDSEKEHQISFEELNGGVAYSNAIKKAYICNANTKKMKPGDIILFYASKNKKSIISIGVIDKVYVGFENAEEMLLVAKRRTAYSLEEVRIVYKDKNTKLIFFKHYQVFDNPIGFNELVENGILKGYPQSITQVDTDAIRKLIEEKGVQQNV